jgi:hypothetical protein
MVERLCTNAKRLGNSAMTRSSGQFRARAAQRPGRGQRDDHHPVPHQERPVVLPAGRTGSARCWSPARSKSTATGRGGPGSRRSRALASRSSMLSCSAPSLLRPGWSPTTGPPTGTFPVLGTSRSRSARWRRTSRCPGSIGCFQTLKRWGLGVYHGLRKTNLQHYLDEFVFRFNRRRTRHGAFDTLLGIGARTAPAPYHLLIRKAA